MLRALAILRTVYLIFIFGYTVRAMPWWSSVPRTFDEQYARCSEALSLLVRAAWLAIAWIAVDTLLSWWLASRRVRIHADIPKGGEPPFAPPPRG